MHKNNGFIQITTVFINLQSDFGCIAISELVFWNITILIKTGAETQS